jgi:hypothetical protein
MELEVQTLNLNEKVLFRIIFGKKIPPLVITRALHREGHKFWTSVPEGRQDLAEKIGPLIESYYRENYK